MWVSLSPSISIPTPISAGLARGAGPHGWRQSRGDTAEGQPGARWTVAQKPQREKEGEEKMERGGPRQDEDTGPVVRVGFRFLGRPGPRRAGLRGVSSFLLAHADHRCSSANFTRMASSGPSIVSMLPLAGHT
ncbi:hypothetical protein EYF80_064762 [Liparis tanakae]|uniref:Uncharacterized protein n=1 Tax=Liparis tanakae TaxID=230148 RepID=A0A4Z2E8H9_9TELE|nr:hypothetical protein EYF80_064762 [Liparis tanakae]